MTTQKKETTSAEVVVENETSKANVTQKNEIVNYSTEALIARAIDQKVDVGTMERLLAMAEKMQAIQAKREFDVAMANFQADCPTIEKQKEVKNDSGKVLYKYAPIDNIISQVKGLLQENGFSYSTNMELLENGVKVFVKVTHALGHSEVTEMNVPLGVKTGIMSASQQVAAAQTFAKRYAFLNAFGIMTGDEDNDGAELDKPVGTFAPTEKQMETIKKNMEEKEISEADLMDEGFPALKDLTGGKDGTASEVIGYLFKRSKYSNGIKAPTDEDRMVTQFIKDLEECTTVEMYTKVSDEVKLARDMGHLVDGYNIVLKVAKITAQRIQNSIDNPVIETKPMTRAAELMQKGINKTK